MSEHWSVKAEKILDSEKMRYDEQIFIESMLIQDLEELDKERMKHLITIYERIFGDYGKEK